MGYKTGGNTDKPNFPTADDFSGSVSDSRTGYVQGGRGSDDESAAPMIGEGIVEGHRRKQGKGAAAGGGNAIDPDPAPTEGNQVIEYSGDEPFQDGAERADMVEGYGPLALATYDGDTDSGEPEGFLKRNNVRERI